MSVGEKPNSKLNLFLLGPLSVVGKAEDPFTPKNQKSKAVLAMLALAPRGSRSRVWLRDKLWSDRGEDQASASLRQALLDIRKSFGPQYKSILLSDKYSVSLDLSCLAVDVLELFAKVEANVADSSDLNAISEHFLEGFDICDPEFEAWLTLERQIWENRYLELCASFEGRNTPEFSEDILSFPSEPRPSAPQKEAPQRVLQRIITSSSTAPRWAIGVQVFGIASPDQAVNFHAQLLADKVTRNLFEMGRINVLRTLESQPIVRPKSKSDAVEIPLIIRIREIQQPNSIRLSIELVTGDTGVTIWSASQAYVESDFRDPISTALNGLTARIVIEVGKFLREVSDNAQMSGAGQLIECIYQIFGLSVNKLNSAEETLLSLLKQQPSAQIYAWMAFSKSFQVGQRFSSDAAAHIGEAQYYATRALEEDEHDPLVLSLAAHIHSYLFSEYDMAASLFERALKADPEQTIGWDLYAMLHAYTGQGKTSLAMASRAQYLGANTPISYYFDTTKCIAAALAGDQKASILAGERALAQRPKFNSILRYLISSHAHMGNVQMVESLLQRLHDVEPDFSTDVLLGSGYPGLTTEGGRYFLRGLQKAGLGSK